MVFEDLAKSGQNTADNFVDTTDIKIILKKDSDVFTITSSSKVYSTTVNDSFIVGHQTLGYLRSSINQEIDCSGNGKHGTWGGSSIGGTQFVNGYRLKGGEFNGTDSYLDVNAVSALGSFAFGGTIGEPRCIFFKPDGLKLYVANSNGSTIHQLTLSAAWDVSSLSYTGAVSFSVSAQGADVAGLYIKSDGTKFWTTDYAQDKIFQYSMGTPWDLSTASYDTISFSVATEELTATGLSMSSDGTKIYVCGSTSDKIHQYNLGTPFDLSTCSYSGTSVNFVHFESTSGQIFWKPDGTKFWIIGASDSTVEFYCPTPWTLSSATTNGVRSGNALIETNGGGLFFHPDGNILYFTGTTNDTIYAYSLEQAWSLYGGNYGTCTPEVTTNTFRKATIEFQSGLTDGAYDLKFNSDGTKAYILATSTNDYLYQGTLSTPYDIKTWTYDSKSYLFTEDATPMGIYFKSDGSQLYMLGKTTDKIYLYNLSVPWDISTISYSTISKAYTSGGATDAWKIVISPNGLNAYIVDNGTNYIYQYSLSVAWDISTLTYVRRTSTGIETTPTGLHITSDGIYAYVTGQALSGGVTRYTMSTPWDISTFTSDKKYLSTMQEIQPTFVELCPDGTKLYSGGTNIDSITQYNLTTPYSFDVAGTGFSVSTWIYPHTAGLNNNGDVYNSGIDTAAARGFLIAINSTNQIYFRINSGGLVYTLANSIPYNTWTHVVTTCDANGLVNIYLNGILSATFITCPVEFLNNTFITNPTLGNRPGTRDRAWDGIIDEFMIFNTILSSQDIQDVMNKNFYTNHSKFSNCKLWYSMDNPTLGDRRDSPVLLQTNYA